MDGYALYSTKGDWDREVPSGIVSVREVLAATSSCAAALWRFLLDHDLMGEVSVPQLAVDDPLLYLLGDPRRVRTQRLDNLWVRLVDVDRALAGRRYAGPVDLVLEVTDAVCRWNEGRFQLSGDTGGATCARTVAAPDLVVDARDLGAAYLGGTSLRALAAAGRVEERRDGAVRSAARAFAGERAPFCPLVF